MLRATIAAVAARSRRTRRAPYAARQDVRRAGCRSDSPGQRLSTSRCPKTALIGGFPIVFLCEQADQPCWSGPEAAGVEVERRQVLFEVDMQPLAASHLCVPGSAGDKRSCDAPPLIRTSDLGIQEESVIASVPSHVNKADQVAIGDAGSHPAKTLRPYLVPPPGCSPAAMCCDQRHHFRIGKWTAPAVFNLLGHMPDRPATRLPTSRRARGQRAKVTSRPPVVPSARQKHRLPCRDHAQVSSRTNQAEEGYPGAGGSGGIAPGVFGASRLVTSSLLPTICLSMKS